MQCLLRRARISSPIAASCLTSSSLASPIPLRTFISSPLSSQKSMPSRPKPPPDSEIEESYLKGSGPGGQKINKTNSAVQLKHIPTGIVVKSQATRSRAQNRKHAREILAQRLDDLYNGDESRASIVGQVKKKRSDSAAKKSRRKYKKLEEEKAAAAAAAGEVEAEGAKSEHGTQEPAASSTSPSDGAPSEPRRDGTAVSETTPEASSQGRQRRST